MDDEKEYITINDLIKEVDFSRETIVRDLHNGKFNAIKSGKTWKISYDEAIKFYKEKDKTKSKEKQDNTDSYKKQAEKYTAKIKELDSKIKKITYDKKSGKLIERSDVEEALRNNLESLQARFQNFGEKMDGCNYKELQDEIDEILLEYHNSQQKALKDIEDE